jgi:hypothetical protein
MKLEKGSEFPTIKAFKKILILWFIQTMLNKNMKYRRLVVEDKLLSLDTDSVMPDLDKVYEANKKGEKMRMKLYF